MKQLFLILAMFVMVLPALAQDHALVKPAADDVHLGTLYVVNNVVEMNDGHAMARCACGAGFEVTDKTPYVTADGTTYHLCSEQCMNTVGSMEETAKQAALGSLQKALLTDDHMNSNCTIADGKKMATCACGQSFEFGTKTPMVIENGMKMGACCDGCAKHVKSAAPEERAAMMKKVMVSTAEVKD